MSLSWEFPSVGDSCLGQSANTTVLFSVALSQTNPPTFFQSTSINNMYLATLAPGMWFWTVYASNKYFTTEASEIRSFLVCNPTPPVAPNQIYPLNGDYVADEEFSLSFSAPGVFGTECDFQIETSYYLVSNFFVCY